MQLNNCNNEYWSLHKSPFYVYPLMFSDPEPPAPQKELEWWETLLQEGDLEDLRASNKLMLLFSILKDCEENGEKL